MSEEFEDLDDDFKELIQKFEDCLFENQTCFFDSEDLIDIIDHYFSINSMNMVESAIDFALSLYPEDNNILIRKAQYIARAKTPQEAITFLEKQRAKTPNDDNLLFALASLYSQIGSNAKAISILKYLLELDDKDIDAYILLGEEYINIEDYTSAVNVLKKALLIEPTDDELLHSYAFAAHQLEDTAPSINFLKTLCEKNPFSENNWIAYSFLLFLTENYFDSITAIDLAIAINDKNPESYLKKAEAYVELGNNAEAIKCYHEALEINPDDPAILFVLGDAYEKTKNFKKAAYYFKEITKKYSSFADAWLGLAICYFEENDFAQAEPMIKKAIELEPDNMHFKLTYAEMLYKEGHMDLSEDIYQSLYDEEEGEDLALTTINWALALVYNNRLLDAINLLRETIDNNQFEEPAIYFTLIELASKEPYLKDHLEDYLFRLFLYYDVSIDMIKEHSPSLLKNPVYEKLIKTYIDEKN